MARFAREISLSSPLRPGVFTFSPRCGIVGLRRVIAGVSWTACAGPFRLLRSITLAQTETGSGAGAGTGPRAISDGCRRISGAPRRQEMAEGSGGDALPALRGREAAWVQGERGPRGT